MDPIVELLEELGRIVNQSDSELMAVYDPSDEDLTVFGPGLKLVIRTCDVTPRE